MRSSLLNRRKKPKVSKEAHRQTIDSCFESESAETGQQFAAHAITSARGGVEEVTAKM